MADGEPRRFERLNAIVKRRYETGAWANTHFEMNSDLLAELRTSSPPSSTRPPFMGVDLGGLMAIPIRLADLPAGEWRLVDDRFGTTLIEGAEEIRG